MILPSVLDHVCVRNVDVAIELPIKASLDSALAAPCPVVERPAADDYDAWQAWAIELLLQYAGARSAMPRQFSNGHGKVRMG